MPTIQKIAEDIINSSQGAIYSEGSKFKIPYIYDLIHQYRETVIRMTYYKTGRVNPMWLQTCFPEFSKDLQESDFLVKFNVPAPAILDDQTDGFVYIGTLDRACNFTKLQNRSELALYANHRATKTGIKTIWEDGFLEVWGNPAQKEVRIDGVFANPTLIEEYNIDISDYPIDGDSLIQLKQLIFQSQTDNMAKSPSNFSQKIVDKPSSIV